MKELVLSNRLTHLISPTFVDFPYNEKLSNLTTNAFETVDLKVKIMSYFENKKAKVDNERHCNSCYTFGYCVTYTSSFVLSFVDFSLWEELPTHGLAEGSPVAGLLELKARKKV